jgi:hypothetical protein
MRCLKYSLSLSLLFLVACVSTAERAVPQAKARLTGLSPEYASANQKPAAGANFAVSALGEHLCRGCRMRLNELVLDTATSADGLSMSANLPAFVFDKAGSYAISVLQPDGSASNQLPFLIYPSTGPAPQLLETWPDKASAGKPFNVQADNTSAMGFRGTGFLPGMKLIFDGRALEANFSDTEHGGITVPEDLTLTTGDKKLIIRNPDGKESAPFVFKVIP